MRQRYEELVRMDLERVGERADALTDHVFDRWLAADPAARRCFELNRLSSQREMLESTFVAVYDLFEGAAWLKWNLVAYGARHSGAYFVHDAMYASYVDALVEGLRAVLAPDFDEAHAAAWREALGRVCEGMRRWGSVDDVAASLG